MFAPIKPEDVPRERAALARWLRELAPLVWTVMIEAGSSTTFWVPPFLRDSPPARVASELAVAELKRVVGAGLFYATPEATEIAIEAGRGLTAGALWRDLLPADSGLMVFGAPIGSGSDGRGTGGVREDVPVVAVTWGFVNHAGESGDRPGVWISYYTDGSGLRRETAAMPWGAETLQLLPQGRLLYEREHTVIFHTGAPWLSERASEVERRYGIPAHEVSASERLLRTVIATWLLMGEAGGLFESRPLADVDPGVRGEARAVRIVTPRDRPQLLQAEDRDLARQGRAVIT